MYKDLKALAQEKSGRQAKAIRKLLLQKNAKKIKPYKKAGNGRDNQIIDTEGKVEKIHPFYVANVIKNRAKKIQPLAKKVHYDDPENVKRAAAITIANKLRSHIPRRDMNSIMTRLKDVFTTKR